MNIGFPFAFDPNGRTAGVDLPTHVNQMIEQLIFTAPGERVMRPDFGSGISQLMFAPNSPELAATVQFTLQTAIQHWLSDVIQMRDLTATAADSTITISLSYVLIATGQDQTASFTRTV